jgi:hypothetical protein
MQANKSIYFNMQHSNINITLKHMSYLLDGNSDRLGLAIGMLAAFAWQ